MRPDDPNNRRVGTPLIPQRSLQRTPPTDHSDAAAGVVRGQIDRIYSGETSTPTPQTTPVAAEPPQPAENTANPYDRTHQAASSNIQAEQWKHYHSAWQDYYQKYYERYYIGQTYRAQKALEARANEATANHTEPTPDTNNAPGNA